MTPLLLGALGLVIVAVGKETKAPGYHSVYEINFWAAQAIRFFYPGLAAGWLGGVSCALWARRLAGARGRKQWRYGFILLLALLTLASTVAFLI